MRSRNKKGGCKFSFQEFEIVLESGGAHLLEWPTQKVVYKKNIKVLL